MSSGRVYPDGGGTDGAWMGSCLPTSDGDDLELHIDEVTTHDGTVTYVYWEAAGQTEVGPENSTQSCFVVSLGTISSLVSDLYRTYNNSTWERLGGGTTSGVFAVRYNSSWLIPDGVWVYTTDSWKNLQPDLELHAFVRLGNSSDSSGSAAIQLELKNSSLTIHAGGFAALDSTDWIERTVGIPSSKTAFLAAGGGGALLLAVSGQITPDNADSTLTIQVTQAWLEVSS